MYMCIYFKCIKTKILKNGGKGTLMSVAKNSPDMFGVCHPIFGREFHPYLKFHTSDLALH